MEIGTMKKILQNTDPQRITFSDRFHHSLRYYFNENDITNRNNGESKINLNGKDELLRSSDSRVSNNFHQLLVDQEAGYLTGTAPNIDVSDDNLNEQIKDALGDDFALKLNQLVVDAANAGVGWVHYWIDDNHVFQYAVIPPDQITPIYTSDLESKLLAVRRTYRQLDPDDGETYTYNEYWTDKKCEVYRSKIAGYNDLQPADDYFNYYDNATGDLVKSSNVLEHGLGTIPFIPFSKNKYQRPELNKYKGLIDVYDNVYNGFVNDVNDVQQVILVLTNYGGESLDVFKETLKKDKAIKVDSVGTGDKSGVDKLTIDIPTEARSTLMEATKADIYVHGQGIDPTNFVGNSNASGVAIKMLYSHLELKAHTTESYFRDGVATLVTAILAFLTHSDGTQYQIVQNWTRSAIQNNLEQAQIIQDVAAYSSREAIAKNNPIVNDPQKELEQLDDEMTTDPFANPQAEQQVNDNDDNDDNDDKSHEGDK